MFYLRIRDVFCSTREAGWGVKHMVTKGVRHSTREAGWGVKYMVTKGVRHSTREAGWGVLHFSNDDCLAPF